MPARMWRVTSKTLAASVLTCHLPVKIGGIPGLVQALRPESMGLPLGLEVLVQALHGPEEAAGVQHGAAGDADRAAPGTHVVGVGEEGALSDQSIQVGGVDLTIAGGADGVEALVVGEQEEDIRRFGAERREAQHGAEERVQGPGQTMHGMGFSQAGGSCRVDDDFPGPRGSCLALEFGHYSDWTSSHTSSHTSSVCSEQHEAARMFSLDKLKVYDKALTNAASLAQLGIHAVVSRLARSAQTLDAPVASGGSCRHESGVEHCRSQWALCAWREAESVRGSRKCGGPVRNVSGALHAHRQA